MVNRQNECLTSVSAAEARRIRMRQNRNDLAREAVGLHARVWRDRTPNWSLDAENG
jgi:hypothetical protein